MIPISTRETPSGSRPVLIDANSLAAWLRSSTPPIVLDVRWRLGHFRGRENYYEGHIPGAVYVDLETDLAGPPHASHGRHPLPDISALQQVARSWGLRIGQAVTVYDDNGSQ